MRCFYLASGRKISHQKSCFHGIGLTAEKIEASTNILKCKTGQLPITYLGLTVGANMNRINNWTPVIQTFEQRLSSWKAGRITLIRSVLDSLPTYFFSLYKAPVCVIAKLEKIRKSFFWGETSSNKKIPWVSWDRVIAPVEDGGLGLGCLNAKNLSLLSKWWWRLRNEPDSLWGRTITSIHFSQRNCTQVPMKLGVVGAWLNIAKISSHLEKFNVSLQDLITGTVGNGNTIRFWIDTWTGSKPLKDSFPDLFKLERNKGCYVRERCTGNGLYSQWEWNWSRSPSTPAELNQFLELLSGIQTLNLTSTTDSWAWACDPSGTYTVKSMKHKLSKASFGPKHWNFPWNNLAPLKTNILGWRLEMNRLPTSDLLLRRNIPIPSLTCPLCNSHDETSQHLFISCPFSDALWTFLLSWCKIPLSKPSHARALFEIHKDPMISSKKSRLINLIVLSYIWTIWKIRNKCIFSNKPPSIRYATKELKSNSFLWLTNRSNAPRLEWSNWCNFTF
ncbi:RNA-directed DNA polymerase, eukaryota, Reverse transcriptase zinc-binding domain protein [Artemisia annua]|uniref:RNA-directed DNA polymerase, eukaryota, Reverse transcriptase zinc-binding domain protein n=1 Tax=Artemisia annua TaxID=35608 RepID=A0A2U1MJ41_ARTAN|nr:RNA-directed DNA polymerase, eukaryota, Reverse transcriptase zinc-binding domain protein [Artemisia annua]